MNPASIQFHLLFDADAEFRAGFCPWTFFAYPTRLADEKGLPPDDQACQLLSQLQRRGLDVAVWVNGIAEETSYFACRKRDMHRLNQVIQQLEDSGAIESDFCCKRSERLFAASKSHRTGQNGE